LAGAGKGLGLIRIDKAVTVGIVPGEILLHGWRCFLLGNFAVPVFIKSLDGITASRFGIRPAYP
jgi:hypothetical protein